MWPSYTRVSFFFLLFSSSEEEKKRKEKEKPVLQSISQKLIAIRQVWLREPKEVAVSVTRRRER